MPQKVLELLFVEGRSDGYEGVDSSIDIIIIIIVGRFVQNSAATRAGILATEPLASALLAEGMCIVQQYGTLSRIVNRGETEISGANGAGGGVSVDDRASMNGV